MPSNDAYMAGIKLPCLFGDTSLGSDDSGTTGSNEPYLRGSIRILRRDSMLLITTSAVPCSNCERVQARRSFPASQPFGMKAQFTRTLATRDIGSTFQVCRRWANTTFTTHLRNEGRQYFISAAASLSQSLRRRHECFIISGSGCPSRKSSPRDLGSIKRRSCRMRTCVAYWPKTT